MLPDLARIHRLKRFVFCSSISVYGDAGMVVIDEGTALHPTSVCGASKAACEQLVEGLPRNMAWRVLVSGLDASMVTCAMLPQRPGQRQKRLS
ncbi:NAD-dependent epimerase/dehydratase family protein [Phyllobacterium trifolii]|uniref:NAD-dependent epimerase/dehydratase family protein n=1 Tax=Phyllobacterium trifolii TaxID=300193 RepID=UPI0035E4329D